MAEDVEVRWAAMVAVAGSEEVEEALVVAAMEDHHAVAASAKVLTDQRWRTIDPREIPDR